MAVSKQEAHPLAWPQDWPRTRPQDRKGNSGWKRTANQYRDGLLQELTRMKSPSAVISTNVPLTMRGDLTQNRVEPLDVGVAVYFSRTTKDDFGWQDALNVHDPAPTEEQIQDAFRQLARRYHPDAGGDATMFAALARHRDNAIRWIRRRSGEHFDYVIACDAFDQVRLNLCAITLTIKAIRQIERCGTTSLLERAFKGFAALPAQGETTSASEPVGAR